MTTEYHVQSNTFAYISCYLEDNNIFWSTSNMPRCREIDTFTFDSRNCNRAEDPLVVIHSWNYQFAEPTSADLLAIDFERAENMKKYILALQTKRETIVSANQVRELLNIALMTKEEIIALLN